MTEWLVISTNVKTRLGCKEGFYKTVLPAK